MPDDLVISQSTVAAFTRCKRKYYLGQYRRLRKRDEYRSVVSIGSLVHAALEAYYDNQEDPFAVLRTMGEQLVAEHADQSDQILKDIEMAAIMVEGYMEHLEETGVDFEFQMIEPEREIRVQIGTYKGRAIIMVGKLDARFRTRDEWIGFLEHKAVGNFVDLPSYAQQDRQILSYEMLSMLESGERKSDGGILNMLRRVKRTAAAKPPFYQREFVRHNITELRNHWRHTMSVAKEIVELEAKLDAGADHHDVAPPVPGRDCRYTCQFKDVCRLFDDGSDVEWVVKDLYEVGDPFDRYDTDVQGGGEE